MMLAELSRIMAHGIEQGSFEVSFADNVAGKRSKANKDKMQRLGFQFKYLTNIYTTKTGKSYYYCYDYGYLPLDNDWYLIVRKKDDQG